MGWSIGSALLAVAFTLAPVVLGGGTVWSQDFSITNPVEPTNTGRRDVMRQLQAWWDMHAFYPRRASGNNEGGTVKVSLWVRPDGNIWRVDLVASSGSDSLDTAAVAAFRGGFVRPFGAGEPEAHLDLSLHYLLAYRSDQPVTAGVTPASSRRPFTITNEPVKSPILETMLQRTCTGTVVKQGIRNHPNYGTRYSAKAVFFRKPDGTPWVKLDEGGYSILAPVTEVGKVVQWTGRPERGSQGVVKYTQYTIWPDGDHNLNGNIEIISAAEAKANQDINQGGTVDLSCATEVLPAIGWTAWSVTPAPSPLGDPP